MSSASEETGFALCNEKVVKKRLQKIIRITHRYSNKKQVSEIATDISIESKYNNL